MTFVDKHKLRDQVLARVSPDVARLLAHPPNPITFTSAELFDDLFQALEAVGGDALLFKAGLEVARSLGGSILAPVLHATLRLLGAKPTTAFNAANIAYSLMTRGYAFHYEEWTPTRGTILVRLDAPLPTHATMIVMQGTCIRPREPGGTCNFVCVAG